MPCYRCGSRQVDPPRGASPWKVGVRQRQQVLICPQCQAGRDWTDELDRCAACGSTALVRRLGETACKQCGAAVPEPAVPAVHTAASGASTATTDPDLAAEVEAALGRALRDGALRDAAAGTLTRDTSATGGTGPREVPGSGIERRPGPLAQR